MTKNDIIKLIDMSIAKVKEDDQSGIQWDKFDVDKVADKIKPDDSLEIIIFKIKWEIKRFRAKARLGFEL